MILKRNLLSAALASAILMTATSVYAQPGSQQDNGQASKQDSGQQAKKKEKKKRPTVTKLQAVEVTGFASSQQNSIATQRNSNAIVEAVSAEQIGKLPGTSIANSLGRLPGLAVQTLAGRPQVLSIHGLGPDFSTALVDGRQQVSTGNNRGVQFDQYPASWFNSVEVHLSPSADLLGQGLAGTVNMKTIRPLEKDKRVMAVNASYVWDGLGQVAKGRGVSDHGYKVNGVWVDQFADHTFGVTVGVDLEQNPTQIQHEAPWGYPNYMPVTNGNAVIGGSKNYAISDLFNRTGLLTTLQYQPNDNFTSTLDMTYDRFHDRQQAKGIEFPLAWGGGVVLQPGYTAQNGLITSGTFTNVKPVIRNDYNRSLAKVYNIGWNNKWIINEDWTFDADASYSRADRHDAFIESYSGYSYGAANGPFDTVQFSQGSGGLWILNNSQNYSASNTYLTDPQGWGAGSGLVQGGFINSPRTMDYIGDLRVSLERSFVEGPIASVKFGIDRANRKKTFNIQQRFLVPNNGSPIILDTSNPGGAQTAPLPSGATTGDPLSFMGVGSQPLYDPIAAILDGTYAQVPAFQSSLPLPPNWTVKETDTTPYVQFNLDTMVGNFPLRGNFGVQIAHTKQSATGERVQPGSSYTGTTVTVPVSGGTTYTRYLPSLNLVLGLNDQTDLRFGAARTMARPRMDQINPSQGVSANLTNLTSTDPNNAYFSASGGNAKLLPSMAQNYNLSIEHYFGNSKGYVSLSGYFIKLTDYINPNSSFPYNFSGYVGSYLTPAEQAQLGTTQGYVTGPTNSGHGYVRGVQGVINTPLGLFTPVLQGFGIILSDDLTQSSIVYDGNPNPITVPGLSEHVINNTLYYERDGFQARVSQSYRSTFLGRIYGISASRIQQNIQGGSTYDAQISYTLKSGAMKGLTILLQGSNLTNKKFITYQGTDPRMIQTWENYGRRYELGVSYKF